MTPFSPSDAETLSSNYTHPCFLNKLYTVETGQGDLYLAKSRNTNNLQLVKPEDALVAKTRNDKNILLIPKRTDIRIKKKQPAIKKKSSYVPEPTTTNKVECLGKIVIFKICLPSLSSMSVWTPQLDLCPRSIAV